MQGCMSQSSLAIYQPKHPHALGAMLGHPTSPTPTALSDASFFSSSHDNQLQHTEASIGRSTGAGAGQDGIALDNALGLGHSLLRFDFENALNPSFNLASSSGSLPGWPLETEGISSQPQGTALSAHQSVLQFPAMDLHDGFSSCGSHDRPHAIQTLSQPCISSSGVKTRQRSKRLATKRTQHPTEDSPESSPVTQSARESVQQNPEADHQFRQILEQAPTALRQMPSCTYPAAQLAAEQLHNELSLGQDLLVPRLSSSNYPAPPESHLGAAVMTLDEALESMSPSKGFGWNNPFEKALGNSPVLFPAKPEGWREKQNSLVSNASARCDQVGSR